MFIANLTYVAPIEVIDGLLEQHVAWLRAGHAAGHFLGWGRKVPRVGGMILAKGESRAAVEALVASDPFVMHGAATVEVIEVAFGFLAPGLELLA